MDLVRRPAAPSAPPPGSPVRAAGRPWWQVAARALAASALLDVALIVWIAFAFARPVLNFNDQHQPSQTDDWQDITSSMELARESIVDHHELPMWNPNFGSGTPFIAEPKTYLFNPVASVPPLIWGVYDGPKIAVFLSLALAGIGMHYLAGTLGISRPWRLWSGVMMSISGAFTARIFAGHYEFVMGLGLVPWVFALSIQALRRPGVLFPILAGVANAMLFFSGHVVFTVYAIPGLALTLLFVAGERAWQAPGRREEAFFTVVGRGMQVAAWTMGIAAVQFLPVWADLRHFPAPRYHLEGSETILGSLNDFYSSDQKTIGPDPAYPYWGFWEYYFYVGWVPFVGLALAALALLRRGSRFALLWAAMLLALYLCWAAAPYTSLKWIYDAYHPLYQFRVPSRALAFATTFLILIAALGFSALTDWLRPHFAIKLRERVALLRLAVASAAVVGLIALCLYGFNDVYDTNRSLLNGKERFPDQREVAQWLHSREQGVVYVQAPLLGQAVPPRFYQLDVKRLDARWEYGYVAPSPAPDMNANIPRTATYAIVGPNDSVPNATSLGNISGWLVYRQPNAPPYASTLPEADRPNGEEYRWDQKAKPAQARIVSANVIDVRATPAYGQNRLLLLESYHSGWRLEIDGRRAGKPQNFAGHLSTPALPGAHTYTFVYDPKSVRVGGAITVGTLLGAVLLLAWRAISRRRAATLNTSAE